MNDSSEFVNENSGFSNSNEIKSNFSFNSPSIPLPGGSGLSKPRIAKTRRQTGTNNPWTSSLSVPDMMVNPRFKPNVSNFDSVPSRADTPFTLGVNATGVANANLSNGLSGNAVKDVIFEMGELNIGIGVNRSDSNVGSSGNADTDMIDKLGGLNIASEASFTNAQNSGFVFKGVGKKSSSSDEIKVSNDMSKLNIGHSGSDEYNRNNKDAPGARNGGINDNAASSFWKSVESELPIEFNKKNVKETPVSSETLLPDHMSNLNLKDNVNLNRVEKNVGYKKTSDDSKFIYGNGTIRSDNTGDGTDKLLLDKMGNMKIESVERDSSIQTDTDFSSHKVFMNKQKTGNLNDKMFQNMGESVPTGFTFNTAMHVKSSESISEIPLVNIPGKNDEFPFTTTEAPHVVFNTPNSKGNLFSNLNQKPEFNARRVTDNNRFKKGRGKLNKQHDPVQVWLGPNLVTGESSFQENSFSPAPYSPMDVSPYEETLANNRSGKKYVGSDDSFRVDESNDSLSTVSNDAMDEDMAFATQRMNINEINEKSEEKEPEFSRGVSTENDIEESMSGADTESFVTAAEELDCSNESFENEVNSRSSDSVQFFSTNSQVGVGKNFIFGSSSSAQGQASAVARQYRKKNRPKIGTDLSSSTVPSGSVLYASSNVQFPYSEPPVSSPRHSQTADTPALQCRGGKEFEFNKEQQHKLVTTSTSDASVAAQVACEKWRLRGNQSYSNGDLTKAEGLYTLGVNCVSRNETSRSCLRALMLCYSNRAATRMALGRFKQAIEDCKLAAVIDPNFLKVQLRSANCYLALGEVAEALQYFRKCLQPGTEICLDQKTMTEASEGLQKTQKVSEYINQSTELIRRRTNDDTESALSIIAEALLISTHSEILLEMKAEALFQLRKYEEVIQLCEESLVLAKVDFPSSGDDDQSANPDSSALLKNFSSKPWRFNMILKSYFYLGKLEEALDLLEKQDGLRNGSMALESSIPLAVIQELLSHKAAGNDAFQSGRHAEAIEHYTAALSCNVESRPFAAICFCNRGAANKSLGQITDAIADCSLAIALDRKYLKALSRRASLYETIRDYGQAANDLQRLVSILVEQVEAKTNQSGASYRSTSSANDLREAQLRLSEMEGESRKEIPLNMYLILGIEPSVSAAEIKKAYRKAALRHHPDKAVQTLARSDNGDDWLWKEIAEEVHKDADRLFKMIGEAYAVLSNPSKRSRYDLEEEMRTARSNVSRTHADTQSYPFDPRSTSRRHWTEVRKSYWHP